MKRLSPWFFVAVVLLVLVSPLIYWSTGIGQAAPGLSPEIIYQPNHTLISSPKAEALHTLSLPMRIHRLIMYPLLLLTFQLSGGAIWLRQRLETWTQGVSGFGHGWSWLKRLKVIGRWWPQRWYEHLNGQDILVMLLFVLLFQLAVFCLYLPFNFYRGFIIGHQFGLSTQTALGWLGDWGKSVIIALLTEALPWVILFGLMRLLPRRWPFPAGALLFTFTLIFAVLAPIFITPLFFEVHPLTDTDLRARILTMADRAGLPVNDVFVIDASNKTTQVNAYVAGFGQARRMVLYDTLISGYKPEEIEAVLAHELGHWYYGHVFWSVLGLGAAGWLALFALRWLLERSWRWLRLTGPADVAGWPYILAVISLMTTLSLPAQNAISRYAENQADEFALTVSQQPAAFIALFTGLAEQNLSIVDPPAWEKFIFYTHPPTIERIQRAESWTLKRAESLKDFKKSRTVLGRQF